MRFFVFFLSAFAHFSLGAILFFLPLQSFALWKQKQLHHIKSYSNKRGKFEIFPFLFTPSVWQLIFVVKNNIFMFLYSFLPFAAFFYLAQIFAQIAPRKSQRSHTVQRKMNIMNNKSLLPYLTQFHQQFFNYYRW